MDGNQTYFPTNNQTQYPTGNQTLDPTELNLDFLEDKNLLSNGVRITGLVFMSICLTLAVVLGIWVILKRNDPVVKAMQPLFLLLLCFGTVVSNFSVVTVGANDENTENIDAACLATHWLRSIGSVVTYAALFSKLWRVNLIFHAQGFQKKVVTVKDVMKPFAILLALNMLLLILLSALDPPYYEYQPISENYPFALYGACTYNLGGGLLVFLLALNQFVSLVLLCVQSYRARDIRSEFSEARGVALALFSALQCIVITSSVTVILGNTNTDAAYMLNVFDTVIPSFSFLFFIFAPMISHQRKRSRGGSTVASRRHTMGATKGATNARISGLEADSRMLGTTVNVVPVQESTLGDGGDQENPSVVAYLETEVQALRSRIAELEGEIKE